MVRCWVLLHLPLRLIDVHIDSKQLQTLTLLALASLPAYGAGYLLRVGQPALALKVALLSTIVVWLCAAIGSRIHRDADRY